MSTFREFYVALLRFINFKVFSDLGIAYPPQLTSLADEELNLDCSQIRELQDAATSKF